MPGTVLDMEHTKETVCHFYAQAVFLMSNIEEMRKCLREYRSQVSKVTNFPGEKEKRGMSSHGKQRVQHKQKKRGEG